MCVEAVQQFESRPEQTPIVACATEDSVFSTRVREAAKDAGTECFTSNSLSTTLDQCRQRNSCLVIDYEFAIKKLSKPVFWQLSESNVLLVAVSQGDVAAAFHCASFGASSVFEKEASVGNYASRFSDAIKKDRLAHQLGSDEECKLHGGIYSELTVREKQILLHLFNGESNKRVASVLDIGLRTVEAGRAGIMKKLKVGSFAELIRLVAITERASEKSQLIF